MLCGMGSTRDQTSMPALETQSLNPGLSRKSPEVFILKSFLEYLNGPPGLRNADVMDKFIVEPRFSLNSYSFVFSWN